MHTTASDGTGTYDEVASAAAQAGLDFIMYTDHNTAAANMDGWYRDPVSGRSILRLMGQEVNDRGQTPEHSHLLCYFVTENLQPVAANPQQLIDTVNNRGGLCFLAHPMERPGYRGAKGTALTYPWQHWNVSGFAGLEIWNAMTDIKYQLRTIPRGLLGAYLPHWVLSGPFPELLAKWDQLLAAGQKVVAIGNSDAHAMTFTVYLIFRRMVYPYKHLFQAVNTHLLLNTPLSRDVQQARRQIFSALAGGHCFVAYSRPGRPRGFTFTAESGSRQVMMGDTLPLQSPARLWVQTPARARIRLIRNGQAIAQKTGMELTWDTTEPGVYRVEAYRRYWGWRRGWIFSNPIYLEGGTQ